LGYRRDPAFMAVYSYLFRKASGSGWRISWASDLVDMQGNGVLRFGQIKMGQRSEGMSIGILPYGSHALAAAQRSDKRRHTVLFATATTEQLEKLSDVDRSADKSYVVIKNGRVPLLIEYPNAVLVWGECWTDGAAESRIASLLDELVRTFIFSDEDRPIVREPQGERMPTFNEPRDELVG
jgi:hypothetical protein